LPDNTCNPNGLKTNRKEKTKAPKAIEPRIFLAILTSRGCGFLSISGNVLNNFMNSKYNKYGKLCLKLLNLNVIHGLRSSKHYSITPDFSGLFVGLFFIIRIELTGFFLELNEVASPLYHCFSLSDTI